MNAQEPVDEMLGQQREQTKHRLCRRGAERKACEGIPTQALEANVVQELLAACELIDVWARGHDSDSVSADKLETAMNAVRAAIAKATPETSP